MKGVWFMTSILESTCPSASDDTKAYACVALHGAGTPVSGMQRLTAAKAVGRQLHEP